MIWQVTYAVCALWFEGHILRLLFIAVTRGHVLALNRPFVDRIETPQTRSNNPKKFWANVVVAIVLLPIASAGVFFSLSALWASIATALFLETNLPPERPIESAG